MLCHIRSVVSMAHTITVLHKSFTVITPSFIKEKYTHIITMQISGPNFLYPAV